MLMIAEYQYPSVYTDVQCLFITSVFTQSRDSVISQISLSNSHDSTVSSPAPTTEKPIECLWLSMAIINAFSRNS